MRKFKIPERPAMVNKTVRFPSDVVEEAIRGKNTTFSAFVIAAIRTALDTWHREGHV